MKFFKSTSLWHHSKISKKEFVVKKYHFIPSYSLLSNCQSHSRLGIVSMDIKSEAQLLYMQNSLSGITENARYKFV